MNFKTILILVSLISCELIFSQSIYDRPSDWARKITNPKFSNLYVLNDSIYRCEQPDIIGFKMMDSIGIKSVLNLRSSQTDSDYLYKLPFNLYYVEMLPYAFGDKEIVKALIILKNSPKPVLVHCLYGSDRTGVVIAMYRIIFQN